MKIAVVFDTLHPDWGDADYKREMAAKAAEAEKRRRKAAVFCTEVS